MNRNKVLRILYILAIASAIYCFLWVRDRCKGFIPVAQGCCRSHCLRFSSFKATAVVTLLQGEPW